MWKVVLTFGAWRAVKLELCLFWLFLCCLVVWVQSWRQSRWGSALLKPTIGIAEFMGPVLHAVPNTGSFCAEVDERSSHFFFFLNVRPRKCCCYGEILSRQTTKERTSAAPGRTQIVWNAPVHVWFVAMVIWPAELVRNVMSSNHVVQIFSEVVHNV